MGTGISNVAAFPFDMGTVYLIEYPKQAPKTRRELPSARDGSLAIQERVRMIPNVVDRLAGRTSGGDVSSTLGAYWAKTIRTAPQIASLSIARALWPRDGRTPRPYPPPGCPDRAGV